jgi:outer membrane protein OmpA-like peptidoglycan-associated protein
METQPMPRAHCRPRRSLLRRALPHALAFCLLPLGTAFAQSNLYVRVTRDGTHISSLRGVQELRMTAAKGTVLEVFHVEGDRYKHQDSNWYWVMLPTDKLGNQPVGWIHGDAVEHVPPPVMALTPRASNTKVPPAPMPQARTALAETPVVEYAAPSSRDVAVAPPVMSDMVLHFEFGKSELTDESRDRLASAIVIRKASSRISVELEGHADWIGPETYNERLGLARAETVRRYLADQLQVPVERISVVSYGENSPAASNSTREGRASNRRVVIKVGA